MNLANLGFLQCSAFTLARRAARVAAVCLALSGAAAVQAQTYAISDLGGVGGSFSMALAINSSGQVAGNGSVAGDAAIHAFVYSDGQVRDLGTLGGAGSYVESIDEQGRVFGTSPVAAGSRTHRFVFENGTMTDLGPAAGGSGESVPARNAAGEVVGAAYQGDSTSLHAFLYQGSMRDLGTLGGPASFGYAVNDGGTVVGSSNVPGEDSAHAFIYSDGQMLDLNQLAQADRAGWVLQSARSINAAGQIVGFGVHDGHTAAFLLTPVGAAQLAFR